MEDIERQYPKLPVIILRAHEGYREDHRLSQAKGYFVKSFELDELKQNIVHVLKRKTASEPMKAGETWHRISRFSSIEVLEIFAQGGYSQCGRSGAGLYSEGPRHAGGDPRSIFISY